MDDMLIQIWLVVLSMEAKIGIGYGALLYESCDHQSSDCPSHASCKPRDCEGFICYCDQFYIRHENNRECIRAAHLSENCLNTNARCYSMFSMCNPTTQLCECIPGYEHNDARTKCKSVGEHLLKDACSVTQLCSLQEQVCSDGFCVCRKGLREFTGEENVAYMPNKYKECVDESFSLERCNSAPSTSIEASATEYTTEAYGYELLGIILDSSSDFLSMSSSTEEWNSLISDSVVRSVIHKPPDEPGETEYYPNTRVPEELLIIPGVVALLLLFIGITLIIVVVCQRRMSYSPSHQSLSDRIRHASNLENSLDFYYNTVPRSHRRDDQKHSRPLGRHSDRPGKDDHGSASYGISNTGVSFASEDGMNSRNHSFSEEYEV